jgi:carbamoyl-phosphate synthase large subunit
MPKRDDIKSVLIIGSGPIVIGQACEFDYSGTQACKVLKQEGLRVILVNSNPATIMTDPQFADATYVEPINPEIVEKIIAKERPDALLATLGGQTALNTAMALHKNGVLEKYKVELIGANVSAIESGENREVFKTLVNKIGGESAASKICHTLEDVLTSASELGYPLVVRPSFTMGGAGSGFANNEAELIKIAAAGLAASPTSEVLLEESVMGWKEYELELMRDRNDNVVVICSIENLDPMGVHTGDSITVAPAVTLTDREYQVMRDMAIKVIREVGVDTGGCNIQFAINPQDGRMIVIEMNPRVSRSSALASKATGFPIAKIAARLALGYTLDEIPNDITKMTPASFEPTLDYIVVKVPRFAFEKFPQADPVLTTHMKSVGEAMAIGRNFTESLQKALRSLEKKESIFSFEEESTDLAELIKKSSIPTDGRLKTVQRALFLGASVEQMFEATKIDPWFLDQIQLINEIAGEIKSLGKLSIQMIQFAKRHGFSDMQIASILKLSETEVREFRHQNNLRPVYKTVDTCAAEFKAYTPYHYSTWDQETELEASDRKKIVILGSGPNRIGQGIEFDYSCVHAAQTLSEVGYETIMINCNPETVSTDYDTSDRLFFEPLTLEDVLEVIQAESASGELVGVIVQLGGQTPLGLAQGLKDNGVKVLGTDPAAIHAAEDRGAFGEVLKNAELLAPEHSTARSFSEAKKIAKEIGYPVLVRPSYVLGGRGMEIVYDEEMLEGFIEKATAIAPEHPVLVDRFLDDALEIDVDALFDGEDLFIAGIMEHIEEAGVHSGDSACVIPPISLSSQDISNIAMSTLKLAVGIGVRGLINVQFALHKRQLYVLEANPRASRTVPFVAKATATAVAKAASRIMAGESIKDLQAAEVLPRFDVTTKLAKTPIAVKEAVLPFGRFHGVDTVLGPEMKSTGEVMGIDHSFGMAFAKSQSGAYANGLPTSGSIFVSAADRDKVVMKDSIKTLFDLGFKIYATSGTSEFLDNYGIKTEVLRKHYEGEVAGQKTTLQAINEGLINLVVNTPFGVGPRVDGYEIRTAATNKGVPIITTSQGLKAAAMGIAALRIEGMKVESLQSHAKTIETARALL